MSVVSADRLTRAYLDKQIARTVAAAKCIGNRGNVSAGRVIPETGDLPIHSGRRLDATVLFLDICKFSERPSWTDMEQENLLQVLSLFFTEMIRVIQDFGGTVEKNTGDGLMAYFAREPGECAAPQQRAMAASLTMFSAAQHLINPIIEAAGLEPLDFRVCLDHGPITVAQVGAARGFNGIVAIGATANVAAKMLSAAKANEILVGANVLDGLPLEWRLQYTKLQTTETGWFYRQTEIPYPFWRYEGRWVLPAIAQSEAA